MNNFYQLGDNLIQNLSLFPAVPWIRAIVLMIMITSAVLCIKFRKKKNPFNTINLYFWLAVMLFFPMFGTVFYLIFTGISAILMKYEGECIPLVKNRDKIKNFINKLIPEKLADKKLDILPEDLCININCPYSIVMNKKIWYTIMIAVVIGLILGCSGLKSYLGKYGETISYDIPLIVWMGITVYDFIKSYVNNFLVIQMSSNKEALESGTRIGTAETENVFRGIESLMARKSADITRNGSNFAGTDNAVENGVYTNNSGAFFKKIMPSKQFGKLPDVLEGQYIGRGVTRYITLNNLSDYAPVKPENVEVIYRVSPRLGYFVYRSAILLGFVFVTCSPAALELNHAIYQFLSNLFGG